MIRWRRPKRLRIDQLTAPPAPFPNTTTGRQLYRLYQATRYTRLGDDHEVRYLKPGDIVQRFYRQQAEFTPEREQLELFTPRPNPIIRSHAIEAEGFLLIVGNSIWPDWLSAIEFHYLGHTSGCLELQPTQITLNDQPIPLPIRATV